jgi:uncharacterized protein
MQIAIIIFIAVLSIYLSICVVYFQLQEQLIFCPNDKEYANEFAINYPTKDVFFDTSDGAKLHGVHIFSAEKKGVLIYFHGNTGNINRWVPAVADLVKFGFDIIVLDYRGYGKTKGKRTEENLYNDSLYFYKYAMSCFEESKIVIYGRSLGTGMAVDLCVRTNANKLILESPFSSMLEIARKKIPIVPVNFLLRFQFRSDLKIDKIKCPILLFHGIKDDVVSYESGKRLFELGNKNKLSKMITLKGGTHRNISSFKEYWENIDLFLKI